MTLRVSLMAKEMEMNRMNNFHVITGTAEHNTGKGRAKILSGEGGLDMLNPRLSMLIA